jgi:hypothetical protein
MALLAALVKRLAKRMPDLNDVLDLEAMLDVVFSSMLPELDFTLEAENMNAFRDRVEDFDTLIPEVLYATPRVLVQGLAPPSALTTVHTVAIRARPGTVTETYVEPAGPWRGVLVLEEGQRLSEPAKRVVVDRPQAGQ